MIPSINAMMAVGVVFIPGMMTGQIIAGADPLLAIRYQIVVMVMNVRVKGGFLAEKLNKCRIVGDLLGAAMAADMAVQANHLIGRGHHQMQVV